jgi:hypothetical protein
MYKLQIDNVPEQDRAYFRNKLSGISLLFGVKCQKDIAIVSYKEPYSLTDNDIMEKGKAISELKKFLADFRVYQFNTVK